MSDIGKESRSSIPYPDRDYRRDKARVRKLAEAWIVRLGLRWWKVDLVWSREPLYTTERDRKDGKQTFATACCSWKYLTCEVTFNMLLVSDTDDEEMEYVVIHELCHALVNEMRNFSANDGMMHEERVVTTLAKAFQWTHRDGVSEGRKQSRKAVTKRKAVARGRRKP